MIWKKIKDFPYKISECGIIKNTKGELLSPFVNKNNLQYVVLNNRFKKTIAVHRLVMETFGELTNKKIYHIDGNKFNNHISNLSYSKIPLHIYYNTIQKKWVYARSFFGKSFVISRHNTLEEAVSYKNNSTEETILALIKKSKTYKKLGTIL
jgi:hypothetical protein